MAIVPQGATKVNNNNIVKMVICFYSELSVCCFRCFSAGSSVEAATSVGREM